MTCHLFYRFSRTSSKANFQVRDFPTPRMKTVGLMVGLCLFILNSAFAHAALCNLVAQNGIACVQMESKIINAPGGTITFTSNNTAGNLIAVIARAAGGQTSTPTDTLGNTYIANPSLICCSGQTNYLSVYYAQNIKGGANTVTLSTNGSGAIRVAIFEYSGLAAVNALDQAADATSNTGSPKSPSVNTTSSPELVIGALQTGTAVTIGAGNDNAGSYTLEQCSGSCSNGNLGTEDQIVTGTESLAATWVVSGSTGPWASIIATFQTSAAPLTYPAARTDNCWSGAESGCVGGRTTGETGSAMSFQDRLTDTIPVGLQGTTISSGTCPSGKSYVSPGYCPAPMNAMGFDLDFGATLVMLTDDTTNNPTTGYNTSWGVASGGESPFSPDESLVVVQSNGTLYQLFNVSPTAIHAKSCGTAPGCVNKTGITQANSGHGDSTHFASGADEVGSLNLSEPTTFYERDNLLVNKLVVTSSISSPGTGTMARTVWADFVNGSGGYGGVLPPIIVGSCTSNYKVSWQGSFYSSNDGSVGFGNGGGYDWCANWTPADSVGNTIFIMPTVNNPGNHGYQATTISGNTGATEPIWNGAGCTSYAVGATCRDGSVVWTDIDSVAGQGPGFDVVDYRPGLGYSRVNTRLAKIYRGSGNAAPSGTFTTNDPVVCERQYGAPCSGTPATLTDRFTLHEAPQLKNGAYVSFAPTGAQQTLPPGNWNSGTLSCQNGGGSFVWNGPWISTTTYTSKQIVSFSDSSGNPTTAYYAATTASGNHGQTPSTSGVVNTTYWTQQEAYCPFYDWNVATTLVSPTTAWAKSTGHIAAGSLYRYYNNVYYAGSLGNESAQLSPPYGPITLNPGTSIISSALCSDDHGSYWNTGTLDLQPVFTAQTDVPSSPARYCAGYGEINAFANMATGASALTYRFAHTYGSGNNKFFANQNSISGISPLGDLMLVSTDMWGTRGDYRAASTNCTNVRGLNAATPTTLNLNDTVFPKSSNNGNFNYNTTTAGNTNGGAPTGGWCQTLNCTVTWSVSSPAIMTNIGANTCRGDAMIVDVQSAHAAP